MLDISPIRPDQTTEARHMIYRVAHQMYHDTATLEETIARYEEHWPLRDIDAFQEKYVACGGIFLVLTEDQRIIGTGGIWRLSDQVCEVKRLWLLPEYQGQGLGYRMMQALLDFARAQGFTTARLETSPEYNPRAYDFYHRLGFYDIPRYGDDPDDIGMERML